MNLWYVWLTAFAAAGAFASTCVLLILPSIASPAMLPQTTLISECHSGGGRKEAPLWDPAVLRPLLFVSPARLSLSTANGRMTFGFHRGLLFSLLWSDSLRALPQHTIKIAGADAPSEFAIAGLTNLFSVFWCVAILQRTSIGQAAISFMGEQISLQRAANSSLSCHVQADLSGVCKAYFVDSS